MIKEVKAVKEINEIAEKVRINWYPGHMKKAREMIEKNVKLIDVVIELLDARIPFSSANPIITELAGEKPRVVVLNKADLADSETVKEWVQFYHHQGIQVVSLDSKSGRGIKQLIKIIEELAKPSVQKWRNKGLLSHSIRTIILGIPNVGKSTLINLLAGSAAAKTADRPGETKGKQWVKIGRNLELLDTPGVLWPKLSNQTAAYRLAATGAIADDVFDMEYVVGRLVEELSVSHPQALMTRYKLMELPTSPEAAVEAIGRKRGCLLSGSTIDLEKARKIILNEFRDGKLGKISLDTVTK